MKITKLTDKQIEMLPKYRDKGIEIGLDTNAEFDETLVKDLIDKHRGMCGVGKTKTWRIFDSPMAACKEIDGINTGNALFGQHDIYWLMYYNFYRIECGLVEETDKIVHLLELAKHVGWMWMGNNTTVITRKPVKVHATFKRHDSIPNFRVLHNENGKALEYVDGTGVCSLNGIRIPKEYEWIITNDILSMKDVLSIKNTEIRTEAIKKIGIEKAFDSLDKTLLDEATYEIGGTYQLYRVIFGNVNRIYLRMKCPSKGSIHFEAVHPDCSTVSQALNWREEGTITSSYQFPLVRT